MALRRKLPSRMAPDSAPESVAAPAKSENSSPRREALAQPEAVAEAVPAAPAATTQTDAFAAAAASAFGTVGTARVLEDSFTPAAAPQPEPAPEPATQFVAPAWEAPAAPQPEVKAEEPAFSAPAWEAAAPAIQAAPMPATEEPAFSAPAWDAPAAETAPAVPEFVAPAWEAPAAPQPETKAEEPAFSAPAWDVPTSAPEPEAKPEVKAEEPAFTASAWDAPAAEPEVKTEAPAFSAPAWETPASVAEAAAPAPQPEPQPEPVAQTAPEPQPEPVAAPAPQAEQVTDFMPKDNPASPNFQPSRPDGGSRRRTREKRPRDFTAMGAPENQPAERNKPTVAFAANVPVNTKPLDKVDEDLIASGIMAPPPPDSLTSSLPTGAAESVFTPPPVEEPASFVAPAPQPEPVVQAVPQPQMEAKPEPAILPDPQPAPTPAAIPVAAAPEVKPYVPRELPDEPEIADEPPAPAAAAPAAPSFTLSNQPKASDPLPPPQSDLPWTQPQASAEWEIESPQNDTWHPDAAPATPSTSQMPQPGDLYGSMGSGPSAPVPPFAAPPRPSSNFTPEIPAQRRRQGGTPWALVAVGAVVAVGAGAWYVTQGGSQQAQQQLASLTTTARQDGAPQSAQPNDMLEPPQVDAAGASFYTPPLATDVSSSSVVNFADVPADQANQPIVADGTEQPPEGMGLFDRLNDSIDKARAEKQGTQTAAVSGTAPAEPTQAAADAALNRQKLNEELAAYRSALAQSSDPAELTPASFRRNPDGYMDGQAPAQAAGTDAILPAPGAAQASVLPPPDLYTNNPNNLPVVSEPVAGVAQRVRTLSDFPDVEAYMPEREKVSIPKNLKPKLAATDFPSLEVLSFVPGKGIVAFADGREGVLLIGESINGWELVNVSPDNAEFKTGQRSHQVTAEN